MSDTIEPAMPSSPVSPRFAIVGVDFKIEGKHGLAVEAGVVSAPAEVSLTHSAPAAALALRWGMICHGVQFHRSY